MAAALASPCRIRRNRRHLRRVASGRTVYAYVGGNPVSYVDPLGLDGFGLIGGGTVEAGIGHLGGGATASGGGGAFWGGPNGANLGAFRSYGAYSGGPTKGSSWTYPQSNSKGTALGAFAGAGGGAFVTNAKCAADLKGPATTTTANIGFGPLQLTIQISRSGPIWMGSITAGPGAGGSISEYPTNTWATGN